MRKLVVFVMLMTCVISAQAQWKVTPEAGMNVTKYKGDVAKVGFKAGAALLYIRIGLVLASIRFVLCATGEGAVFL